MSTDLVPECSEKFRCEQCDYFTSRKSQYNRHLLSSKHINQQKSTDFNQNVPKSSILFICSKCNKKYKDRSGLWRHKQKCKVESDDDENKNYPDNISDKELIIMLIKQNSELIKETSEYKNMMLKVIENGTHNNNNNTTNSHNKAFNLNFFLNETCKDAMNIMDFVDSIKLQLSDLERVGELGFVDGISNIINSKLQALDVTQRPVHCTDKKREVLYIKDENKWEKENEDKTKIRKAIKHIAHKNSRLIPQFKEKHPDCGKSNSKYCDQYSKLIIEAMGGNGENDMEKEDKIIKNISKNVTLNKEIEI
jgi:hypothetical protein